ncbi:Transcription factor GTE4 [Morella rubra]|uniref:Transcription factor GTE4 n=1 Tax=Morella rubra TaxID=262757 RepID=A0A6A1VHR7_9ROSI|nr:Transcription factor GTE4 [Morella rubra]
MASGPIVEMELGRGRGTRRVRCTRKAFKGPKKNTTNTITQSVTGNATTATNDDNSNRNENHKNRDHSNEKNGDNNNKDEVSDDSSNLNQQQEQVAALPATRCEPSGNGTVKPGLENRVKIHLASRPKQEMREVRRKLESELDMVRSLVKRIETKQGQIGGYSHARVSANDGFDKSGSGAKRVHSEVASIGVVHREVSRPLHQLSISVLENSQGVCENVEKEKRTPKANQFYRNSEFLLAKDKFPPAESNKKSKSNGKKQGLGLHVINYNIIKHPMDLGSVKSRLNKNWYKSPKEFAEDVRLTFSNAMTYNPKGQDVHVMAEQLLKVFEDRWAIIESDYNRGMRYAMDYGMGLPMPTSRKAPQFPPPPLDMRRILDRSESMTNSIDPKLKPMSTTPSARTPAPKKPKAKDPHKRDMTYDEKQKLSTNLQNLPSEKLDAIVQIIKKRNSALCQDDDEIEVDIDSVDAETLWELDRFVTNYKKSLSKHKRKAELAIRARAEAAQNVQEKIQAPVEAEVTKENKADERNVPTLSPVQGEKQVDNGSRSSSSSSSSSDSGSSSSDSDSESSSGSGSDVGSPRT